MLTTHRISDRGLFWFGGSLAAPITTLGAVFSWRAERPFYLYIAAAVAIVVGLIFYAFPKTRRPIYDGFNRAVYPIQLVVTCVLLGIVYFAILTPIAAYLRRRGYDSLRRRSAWKKPVDTYWVKREEDPDPKRYFKTY